MNKEDKLKSIRKVLDFNSKIIFYGLYNKKISENDIEDIKKECSKISDIYSFNLNCSNAELYKQIAEFSNKMTKETSE